MKMYILTKDQWLEWHMYFLQINLTIVVYLTWAPFYYALLVTINFYTHLEQFPYIFYFLLYWNLNNNF
jgi:hypothetical protein